MKIRLKPVTLQNREAVLELSVRDDQPYIRTNRWLLEEAAEQNEFYPDTVRPFGIYADERLVGFAVLVFDEEEDDPDLRYWLWKYMIDEKEQGKGYGKAALERIIRYFRSQGADRILLSSDPDNSTALDLFHRYGFQETGDMRGSEMVLMLTL